MKCLALLLALIACEPTKTEVPESNQLVTSITVDPELEVAYCATISLTNVSDTPVYSWALVFDIGSADIQSVWGGNTYQSGSVITVNSFDLTSIAPGESSEVGLCAKTPESTDRPVIVSITARD